MRLSAGVLARMRDLWPIFLVAIGVALAYTVAGSVVDRRHNVDADELAAVEVSAVPAPDGTQVLLLRDWGMQLTAPLAAGEVSTLKYSSRSGDSIGLGSDALEPFGPDCQAARNALGTLLRAPAGTYATAKHSGPTEYFIAQVGQYEYTYRRAQGNCTATDAAHEVANREATAIIHSLESLAATAR